MEAIVKLFARPEMEYPVYQVTIEGHAYYIQRMDEMNSGSFWNEVFPDPLHPGLWMGRGGDTPQLIGFTKKEAIELLKARH